MLLNLAVHFGDINEKCHFLLFLIYLENNAKYEKISIELFCRKLNFLSTRYMEKFFRYKPNIEEKKTKFINH